MNITLKIAVAAAAVVVVGTACSPSAAITPSSAVTPPTAVTPSAAIAPSVAAVPSSAASPSTVPSAGLQVAHLMVAGTDVNGSPLALTVDLPPDWEGSQFVANRGTSSPPAGMAFVVSQVDNTFADPCAHTQRSPKVGPTVADLAKALGEIPHTTATTPVQTTLAGHPATYIEIAIPASLPCDPSQFYLWQDSPDNYWWVQGLNETARVWILDVGGQRVTFLTHAYPGSSADPKADFQKILDSVVFDVPSTQPSATPAAS